MNKNPVWEAMTKITSLQLRTVRVWSELDHPTCVQDVRRAISGILQEHNYERRWSPKEIATKIGSIDGVTAVEVLVDNGDGVVFYPDWK